MIRDSMPKYTIICLDMLEYAISLFISCYLIIENWLEAIYRIVTSPKC